MTNPRVIAGLNTISKQAFTRTAALTQELDSETPPPILYHYTPQSAAYSILKRGELWATHTEYLNDSTEQRHIQMPLEGAWNRLWLFSTGPAHRMALQLLGPGLLGTISPSESDGIAGPVDAGNRYVACFCANGDMLSQWRGYGGTGPAYAIGFDSSKLAQLRPVTSPPESPTDSQLFTQLVRVQYHHETQVETLFHLLRGILNDIMALLGESHETPNDYAKGLASIGVHLRWYIMRTFAARYKDEGFDQEHEWRLVTRSYSPETPLGAVDFRPTSLGMAPYMKLRNIEWLTGPSGSYTGETKEHHLPIAEVVQGPIENAEPGWRSMTMMLRKWEYKHDNQDVEVDRSTIPYRPT